MSVPDRLLRVTAVAGGRRSDLAVPGGVAVAELVPDLARAVGLLDPAAVYAGYRLHAHGRRLRPDQGLSEQGVEDGALLAVAAGADAVAPTVHDDLAEAVAETVQRQRAWEPADTRRTTLAAGLLALAVGLGALGWCLLPPIHDRWATPTAVLLTLVVLAGNAMPAAAVALGAARADAKPVDHDRVAVMVARSTRLYLAASTAIGAVALAAVPVVAVDAVGAVLAADCCLVLLLRARRHRSRRQVLVDVGRGPRRTAGDGRRAPGARAGLADRPCHGSGARERGRLRHRQASGGAGGAPRPGPRPARDRGAGRAGTAPAARHRRPGAGHRGVTCPATRSCSRQPRSTGVDWSRRSSAARWTTTRPGWFVAWSPACCSQCSRPQLSPSPTGSEPGQSSRAQEIGGSGWSWVQVRLLCALTTLHRSRYLR